MPPRGGRPDLSDADLRAAIDAGVDARIIYRLSAAPDHPIGLAVPEGEYLKGLACQVG